MGATIEGKGRVFAKEHEGWTSYTLGISSKDKDGKWVNAYQPIRFKSGEGVPNNTQIEYKAFPVVKARTVDGQNRNYIVWQILEYHVEGEMPDYPAEAGFTALEGEEIPF